ncbi:RagB/SusD family nutrient uptake outer membrane protein [Salegentibacter salegens]|uniref:SusD family protein n=1 Tax=Salegentibacter salegens TaxID=143223 RepID=A0A1M7KTQ3_9FLAO|nr:RagB/SusD family nutrient uptake outer membrane protein [Salegentibacter salegens]PRX43801.1 SusD-like starch-binding protein associating with outer membrane [Salegentibacter salegens]SHM68849.1 SusD family protein [Salegentibacter salegens]
MKKSIKFILVIFWTFLSISCSEDFLEIDPEQNVAAENAVIDLSTLQTAVNGVYSNLQSNGYYGRNLYVMPELMADNLYLSLRNTGRYLDFNNFVVSEEDSYVESAWNSIYEVAVNATRVIEGGENLLEQFPGQEAQIKQLLGEAYTLRSLAHFDLVRLFAQPYNFTADASHPGIPLITEINENEVSPSRNSVNEVYQHINSDLSTAVSLMTEANQDGRFSVNAAYALAARVALYEEENEKAITYSTNVIESSVFSLIPNERYMELWSVDFNEETLMEVINTIADNAGTNGLGHFFDVTGYADALVTEDLVATYDESDVRLHAILEGSKPGAEEEAYFVNKFPNGTLHDDNIKILRLAEQYLIRAEAYAKTGQNELAQQDLQVVMSRANPGAEEVGEVGNELIDRILLERRKELAFEGHRLFDLNRNKRGVSIDQGEGNVIEASYPNEKFILPIPLSEINANTNIEQNPGY